jgi:hypothetical protein
MAEKNPLDEIVDDLVVFKHEDPTHPDGQYFSNNPMWQDSRIREHWMSRHSDEAVADRQASEASDEDIADLEGDDYETWTNEQLRTELASRELSVDGKKVDLVNRLREDDAAEQE